MNIIQKPDTESSDTSDYSLMINTIDLLNAFVVSSDGSVKNNAKFLLLLEFLNSNGFTISDTKVKNSISKLNEYWMAKVEDSPEVPNMEYFTLKHLFQLCLLEKPVVSFFLVS